MKQVGVYEAKTSFSELIAKVEGGDAFEITKHHRVVARLVPVQPKQQGSLEEHIRRMRAFRAKHTLGPLKLKDLIEEGRR